MHEHEHKAIEIALIEWFRSQDISPKVATTTMVGLSGSFIGLSAKQRGRDVEDLAEGLRLATELLTLSAAQAYV